jgi:hypothetical protein
MTNVYRYLTFKPTEDRPARERDRSLRGKARRRARKAANKARKGK